MDDIALPNYGIDPGWYDDIFGYQFGTRQVHALWSTPTRLTRWLSRARARLEERAQRLRNRIVHGVHYRSVATLIGKRAPY
jgi:hypothetical protein